MYRPINKSQHFSWHFEIYFLSTNKKQFLHSLTGLSCCALLVKLSAADCGATSYDKWREGWESNPPGTRQFSPRLISCAVTNSFRDGCIGTVRHGFLTAHKTYRTGPGIYLFCFSLFSFRFSFGVCWAFFCFSLLALSFFPLSPMADPPLLEVYLRRSAAPITFLQTLRTTDPPLIVG
jgi:hypothetical protein